MVSTLNTKSILFLQLLLGVLLLSMCGRVGSFTIQTMAKAKPTARTITTRLDAAMSTATAKIEVGSEVGSGSYGTVHLCTLQNGQDDETYICKRAWNADDLRDRKLGTTADRCQHYFKVEKHCFEKIKSSSSTVSKHVTRYIDTHVDDEKNEWMVFELLKDEKQLNPALTLHDLLALDRKDHHASKDGNHHHYLYLVQQSLGLSEEATLGDTLDAIFLSLLKAIQFVHSQGIVHRDVKPGNLLMDASSQGVVLIDFGSAADMDPVPTNIPFQRKRVGLEDDRVAVTPIYTAPEIMVQPNRSPFAFDVYSSALVFCQLLFNYLDERTDAAFYQQIEDANWDLDAWLSRELSSKVRPAGLDNALEYLTERPGLWGLLCRMFQRDPEERISSNLALQLLEQILSETSEIDPDADGPFFESVVRAMDNCEIPFGDDSGTGYVEPRALHYVASFRRKESLGLILSEATDDVDLKGEKLEKWNAATRFAEPGDVFIMDVVDGGQAEEIGGCEIGDRLQAVGTLPVANGGFQKVVDMLQTQPKSSKYVTLQFDRLSERVQAEVPPSAIDTSEKAGGVRIVDEGAWSSRGKRNYNEDTFLLHDIHLDQDALIAGVFDGHGGNAASQTAAQLMPALFTEELTSTRTLTSRQALELAWQTTCDTYRQGCDEMGECVADYNRRDGILLANTGSDDMVAGTTASVVSLKGTELTVLNCGDSRTMLVDVSGQILFCTNDHTPESEFERFQRGIDKGLDLSLPQCSISKWWITCGDIQYGVARSLEGPFATSKGIISDADVTSLRPNPGILLMATDGLWEVCGSEEVARELARLRHLEAGIVAKHLCSKAVEKGSQDNVSVVIVYLE